MATPQELQTRIQQFTWADLRTLWAAVQKGTTPGWDERKALEYLVLRAFELDITEPVVVRYPYDVHLFGEKVEEGVTGRSKEDADLYRDSQPAKVRPGKGPRPLCPIRRC